MEHEGDRDEAVDAAALHATADAQPPSDATSSPTQTGVKKEAVSPSACKEHMSDAFQSEPHSVPIAAAAPAPNTDAVTATKTEAADDSNAGPLESAPTDTDMGSEVPASSLPRPAAAPAPTGATVPVPAEDDEDGDSDDDEDAASAGTPDAKRTGQVAPSSSVDAAHMALHDLPLSRAALPILLLSPSHAQAHLSASSASKGSKKNARVSCHQCKTTKDDGLLLFCTTKAEKGKRKRKCRKKYCDACLRRSYNMSIAGLTPHEISTYCCPACLGSCSCAACQRKQVEGPARKETAAARPAPALAVSATVQRAPATAASASAAFGALNPLFNMNTFLNSLTASGAAGEINPQTLASLVALQANYLPFLAQSTPTAAAVAAANGNPVVAAALVAATPAVATVAAGEVAEAAVLATVDSAMGVTAVPSSSPISAGSSGSLNAASVSPPSAVKSPSVSTPGSTVTLNHHMAKLSTSAINGSTGHDSALPSLLSPSTSSVSGSKSVAELAALSPNSLKQQHAIASAAAATTQAEIADKTRQLQQLLARRMSQDPNFLVNLGAAATSAQPPIPSATQPQLHSMAVMCDGHGVAAHEVHDELHSTSPPPVPNGGAPLHHKSPASSAHWEEAQYYRDHSRSQVKLENQFLQRLPIPKTVPAKSRSIRSGSQGATHAASHLRGQSASPSLEMAASVVMATPLNARSMSGSALQAMESIDQQLQQAINRTTGRNTKAPRSANPNPTAPGRIYKRKSGASSPYSRPEGSSNGAGSVSRRMSPLPLFDHNSAPSSLSVSPSIHARSFSSAQLDMEDDDEGAAFQGLMTSPPPPMTEHGGQQQHRRNTSGSSSNQISPSDPNYHRLLAKRMQQQQMAAQQQQDPSYSQRLIQANRIMTDQKGQGRSMSLHPHSHLSLQPQQPQLHHHPHPHPATRPLHGHTNNGRQEEFAVDVHRANHYQYPAQQAGVLFSPLPNTHPSSSSAAAATAGLFSPPIANAGNTVPSFFSPLAASNMIVPPLDIGLNPHNGSAPSSVSSNHFIMGSPEPSNGGAPGESLILPSYSPLPSMPNPSPTPSHSIRMPGLLPHHLGGSPSGGTNGGSSGGSSSSFLFTPMAPQTPSIFIHHGGLNSVAPHTGPQSEATLFDWSQAQPSRVGAAPSSRAAGLSKLMVASNSPTAGGNYASQINGSNILGLLTPTPSRGDTNMGSPNQGMPLDVLPQA